MVLLGIIITEWGCGVKMTIKRVELFDLVEVLKKMKTIECKSVQTKYNILKFEKILKAEMEIANEQLGEISQAYGERDSNGELIFNEGGGVKIDKKNTISAQEAVEEFYRCVLQIPDFYFSLEELEIFNLDWVEVEALYKFIK